MRVLRDFVLAPAGVEPPARAQRAPAATAEDAFTRALPATVALLCAPGDARALGVAAAALLARRRRAPCGLACVWTGPEAQRHPEARAPAARAARRLATALGARGLDAVAGGRAVVVALPADPAEAASAAGRACAAAGAAPTILVVAGPRDDAFDTLLAGCDRALVVARPGADEAVGALAVARLGMLVPSAFASVRLSAPARALAAAGVAVTPGLRRVLAAILGADALGNEAAGADALGDDALAREAGRST